MALIRQLRANPPETAGQAKALAEQTTATAKLFADLVRLAETGTKAQQIAATQIGKRWIETGFAPSEALVEKWLALLSGEQPWECKLQVLQTLPALPVPERDKEAVWSLLREWLSHENKFIRAWSYGGLAHVADQFAEFRTEAIALLRLGMRDEPASVKARIRNALKAAKALPNSID